MWHPIELLGILEVVKNSRVLPILLLCFVFASLPLLAGSGTFRGTVIDPPAGFVTGKVLFVKSRNGVVRKVDVSSAAVVYGGSVPEASRDKKPASALKSGVDVRVTAEQGESGDWQATQVEIVGPQDEQKPVEREKSTPLSDDISVT